MKVTTTFFLDYKHQIMDNMDKRKMKGIPTFFLDYKHQVVDNLD
jgi:hypothetical protein